MVRNRLCAPTIETLWIPREGRWATIPNHGFRFPILLYLPLNNPRSKPRGFEFVDWKSTPVSVIPAHAGIQVLFELAPRINLDAGLRRHDESSLRLKVRDFNHPREGH
jgi:hypothetical protein